jgi:hypothetical protein
MTYEEALDDLITAAYIVWLENPAENERLCQALDIFCAQQKYAAWWPWARDHTLANRGLSQSGLCHSRTRPTLVWSQ